MECTFLGGSNISKSPGLLQLSSTQLHHSQTSITKQRPSSKISFNATTRSESPPQTKAQGLLSNKVQVVISILVLIFFVGPLIAGSFNQARMKQHATSTVQHTLLGYLRSLNKTSAQQIQLLRKVNDDLRELRLGIEELASTVRRGSLRRRSGIWGFRVSWKRLPRWFVGSEVYYGFLKAAFLDPTSRVSQHLYPTSLFFSPLTHID